MNWKAYLYAALACIILVGADALLLNVHDNSHGPYTGPHDWGPKPGEEGRLDRDFTKQEFDHFAYQKTKAEIRAAFGSPDSVDDAEDSWYYGALKIYDASAGTHASVVVRFEGLRDDTDAVAQVRFQ